MRHIAIAVAAAVLIAAPAKPGDVASDETIFHEHCIAGGDSEAVCACTLKNLRASYAAPDYALLIAMIVTGLTGDAQRSQRLSALFGSNQNAFAIFANDGRKALDSAITQCRQ